MIVYVWSLPAGAELEGILYPFPPSEASSPLLGDIVIRCVAVSATSEHLACGDRGGNVRLFELRFFEQVALHGGEGGEP